MSIRLEGADAVEQLFGFCPTFHDAEILRIEMDRKGPRLDLHLRAWAKPETYVLAHLAFHKVSDLNINEFNYQNVIGSLALDPAPEDRIRVVVYPIFGAACSFTCRRGEVINAARTDLHTGVGG